MRGAVEAWLLPLALAAGSLAGALLWRRGRGGAVRRAAGRLYQPLAAGLLFALGVSSASGLELGEAAAAAGRAAVYLAAVAATALAAGLAVERLVGGGGGG